MSIVHNLLQHNRFLMMLLSEYLFCRIKRVSFYMVILFAETSLSQRYYGFVTINAWMGMREKFSCGVDVAALLLLALALVGPLLTGALADQRFAAEKVYRVLSLISSITLAAAFITLDFGWHPVWFMFFIGSHALLSAPT